MAFLLGYRVALVLDDGTPIPNGVVMMAKSLEEAVVKGLDYYYSNSDPKDGSKRVAVRPDRSSDPFKVVSGTRERGEWKIHPWNAETN